MHLLLLLPGSSLGKLKNKEEDDDDKKKENNQGKGAQEQIIIAPDG